MWLSRTRDAIIRTRERELRQYNISCIQSTVMQIIQALGDKATPAEISRWAFRESQSVSELLNRMEKEGLVEKIKDLDRKNMVRAVLTERGLEAYRQVQKYSLIAHESLGCRGVSRSDFRYDETADESEQLIILEINTQPGMTGTSLVPEIAEHAGHSYEELVDWMIKDASCDR